MSLNGVVKRYSTTLSEAEAWQNGTTKRWRFTFGPIFTDRPTIAVVNVVPHFPDALRDAEITVTGTTIRTSSAGSGITVLATTQYIGIHPVRNIEFHVAVISS